MNVYIPYTARLPSAYQEVEYIQTTGTQFIDTGLYADSNIQVETKVEKTVSNQEIPVFGSVQGNWSAADPYYCFIPYNNKWYWGINNSEGNGGTYTDAIGTKYTIVFNNSGGRVVVNNTDIGSCSGAKLYSSSYTLGISVRRASSPDTRLFGQYKYFYFKMYNKTTGEYERDLVPCYRKSDNVIGMYDLVNDQFYTNSGTGTFGKGNDVTMNVLKNIYIGEYKGYSVDFTTATAASLQADGFTTYGNLGLDSKGMYVSSGDNAECGVYKAVDLTGCSKFTLKFYSSLTSGSWAGGPNLGIGAISGSSLTSPYSWLNFRSNSNSGYCGEQLFYENSIIAQNATAKSNGDYTTTIVYDFSNSTVSVTTTGPTPASYSASLSSAQVTALTQNRYIKYGIGVGGWSAGRYNRLKKVERIIE